jgi:hypothetical protein
MNGIAETARVLKPGGVCAITVPNAAYPILWDPLNYCRERMGLGHFRDEPLSGIWTDHQRLYTRDQVVALVSGAGLEIEDVRLETRYSFPFSHQLIYGMGKFVVEHTSLGEKGGMTSGRSSFWTENGSPTKVQRLSQIFTAFDRLNRESYDEGRSVNICIKATKPA